MNCEKITPLNESFPDIEFVIEREKVAKDYRNVIAFFTQDESLVDSIAFDTLSNRVVFTRNMPWRKCSDVRNGTEWTDSDTLNFIRHAGDNYRVIFRVETVDHAIMMLAQERRFCPIQKYLDQLQWDGIPRIYNVFADFLGVERNAYTIEVSSLFFRAAVTRAYRPGCQFDHAIILQGAQGIGKSSFLRILGGDWYSSSIRKFEGKEAIEALNGVLIGEICNIQAFSKSKIGKIKAFITRTEDSVRPAYGRWVEHLPRRTLFVGTTNDDDYLRDSTGNCLFFPLFCTKELDFKALEAVRDQLFAEAVALYHSMPNYPLTLHSPEARVLAKSALD